MGKNKYKFGGFRIFQAVLIFLLLMPYQIFKMTGIILTTRLLNSFFMINSDE
jgi:hypothetical protein